MARARRAKPRRSRVLVGLIVVALLAGGAVAALRFWPQSLTAIGPPPSPVASAATDSAEPTPEMTATPSPSTEPTTATAAPASAGAVRAMESCRDRVRAADKVLEQARTGIGHWQAHVAAQRDADRRDISAERQQEIFKETRLKGPADQKRYAAALRDYDRLRDASCDRVEEADSKVAAMMAGCRERASAQRPVMAAAADAMGDWKSHLAAMQRSREVHVANAQQVWIDAYRAAPSNLEAYEKAREDFDAPRC
jgi:pyruvate/2-oxoglutarate dehydrogenase complex dihydrolipoamide acyltransferase (E2) component